MSQEDKRTKYEILNLQRDIAATERGMVTGCLGFGLGLIGVASVAMGNPDIVNGLQPFSNYHDFMQYLYSIGPAGILAFSSTAVLAINSARLDKYISRIYNMLEAGLVTPEQLRENDEKHGTNRGLMGFLRKTVLRDNRDYSLYDTTKSGDLETPEL